MKVIRIHSTGFRQLFMFYHGIAAIGLLILTTVFSLSSINSYAHFLLIIAALLMIVLPLFLAPPEIILDTKVKAIVYREKMTHSKIYFSDIRGLTINDDIMQIRGALSDNAISIYQHRFRHIPLGKMKAYIDEILVGKSHIDKYRFNAVPIGRRLLIG